MDRFCSAYINEQTRRHTLALEFARLDQLQEVFYARALEGDVASGQLVQEIIDRRCIILGLSTAPTAVFQVVDVAPKWRRPQTRSSACSTSCKP